MVDKIPQGFATITSSLTIDGAEKAIELYQKALGAEIEDLMHCPVTGKVMHACLKIGDSKLFVADHFPETGCPLSQSSFYLYVDDADAAFKKASAAGFTSKYEVGDMFWGDRTGSVMDPYGNLWSFATHVKDMSEDEIKKAAKEWADQQSKKAA